MLWGGLNICGDKTRWNHVPEDVPISRLTQGVDLDLRGILVLEDPVEADEDVCRLALRALALEAKLLRKTECLLLAEALLEVNGGRDDGARVLRGNLLNVHATLGRRHEHGATDATVVQDRDVILVGRIPTFREHDLERNAYGTRVNLALSQVRETYGVADAATSTSLLRDQLRTNHLASVVLGLFRTTRKH